MSTAVAGFPLPFGAHSRAGDCTRGERAAFFARELPARRRRGVGSLRRRSGGALGSRSASPLMPQRQRRREGDPASPTRAPRHGLDQKNSRKLPNLVAQAMARAHQRYPFAAAQEPDPRHACWNPSTEVAYSAKLLSLRQVCFPILTFGTTRKGSATRIAGKEELAKCLHTGANSHAIPVFLQRFLRMVRLRGYKVKTWAQRAVLLRQRQKVQALLSAPRGGKRRRSVRVALQPRHCTPRAGQLRGCGFALSLRPASVESLDNLGNAIRKLHRPDEALACFRRALALQPPC